MLRWFGMLAGLAGCDEPVPTVIGFVSGETTELGPVRLEGPPEELLLVGAEDAKAGSTVDVVVKERLESTDLADAVADDAAIDGGTAIRLGGEVGSLAIGLDRPEFVGRRVEVRFWQRPEGTRVEARLLWLAGDDPLEQSLGGPFALSRLWREGVLVTLGTLDFLPTGRRTNEGWEEWTSGPVDYAFGGVEHLTPLLLFRDVEMDHVWRVSGLIRTDRTALLDLLQIVDAGPAAVPEKSCRLANEASRCGRQGACALGRCVDAAARFGAFADDDGMRTDLAERRALELQDWSGARQARDEVLDDSVDAVRRLGSRRTTARKWWLRLTEAVRDLEDGHSFQGRSLVRYATGGLCLDLGVADLLGLDDPLPLVTHHFGTAPWNEVIRIGDVLVEVDGEPTNRWLEDHATPLVGTTGRSSFQQVANVTRSMSAAVGAGSLLTFERCPGEGACEDAATRVEVDLAEVVASIWEQPAEIPDLLRPQPRACDHRLDPVVAEDESRAPRTFDLDRRGGVPVLQLNGLGSPEVADAALGEVEDKLVIDARAGTGGSLAAELALAGLFTSSGDSVGLRVDPWFERQPDETGLNACTFGNDWCFGSFFFGFPTDPARSAALRAADVVLLNHVAVSANDLLSLHVQERCIGDEGLCGDTTLLGGADSAGGFSPPLTGPSYLLSDFGAWLTPYDAKVVYDESSTSDYLVGTPVLMDELVLQLQSDAVRGVDTQLEAALEAIR